MHQDIIWTNARLLAVGCFGIYFSENLFAIQIIYSIYAFENAVCKMKATLSRSQHVKYNSFWIVDTSFEVSVRLIDTASFPFPLNSIISLKNGSGSSFLTKFTILLATEIVRIIISGTASDDNIDKMTFPFQWLDITVILCPSYLITGNHTELPRS